MVFEIIYAKNNDKNDTVIVTNLENSHPDQSFSLAPGAEKKDFNVWIPFAR